MLKVNFRRGGLMLDYEHTDIHTYESTRHVLHESRCKSYNRNIRSCEELVLANCAM
jgi:hypothetical protein